MPRLFFDVDAGDVAFGVAAVDSAVGEDGDCPAGAAEDLAAGDGIEAFWGSRCDAELAPGTEDDELAVGSGGDSAGADAGFFPYDFSGFEVDAPERVFIAVVAVDSVEVAIDQDCGIHLGHEIGVFPDFLRLRSCA